LIWLRLSDGKRFVVDTGVDTRDAMAADLLGHHGVLLIHKRQQVRFYDLPSPIKDRWTETELYTIYTPSTEGGLVLADIDGDGLPDLLCGNYWMKSPTAFELPWREFAIDTWNEVEASAMLRLAWNGRARVAAQRARSAARRNRGRGERLALCGRRSGRRGTKCTGARVRLSSRAPGVACGIPTRLRVNPH
jgi:hypothetical protein